MRTRLLVALSALAVILLVAGAGNAASPSSGTIGPTTTSAAWQGQSYPATAIADPTLCPPASLDPTNAVCDHFALTVGVAPSYWTTNVGGASVTITWGSSDNDFDLYIYDSAGNEVASSAQGGTTSEQAFIPNASGTYDVVVVPFTVSNSGYSGNASFISQAPATYATGGPVAYHGVREAGANPVTAPQTTPARYKGPQLALQWTDVGREAAEPTLGVDKTGTAFYAAATFDGPGGELAHTLVLRSKDAGLTWQATTPELAGVDLHPATLDPYVYLDTDTSRLFDIDTLLAGTTDLSFSDNQGASWLTTYRRHRGDRPPDADRSGTACREPDGAAAHGLPEDRLLLRQLGCRLRLQPQPGRRDHVHAHGRSGIPWLRRRGRRPLRRPARAHRLGQRRAALRAQGSLRLPVARDLERRRDDVEPRPGVEGDRRARHPDCRGR